MNMYHKLITFDITGTLLKTKRPLGDMYAQAAKAFGLPEIDPSKITKNYKSEWNTLCENHPNFGLHSGLGWKSWWKCIVRSTLQNSSDQNIKEKNLNDVSAYLIELFSTKEGWRCEDGARDLLKCLHSNRVELGVISNFDDRLHNVLKELELIKYFSFVLTSYETTYLKPDVKIFKLAEKRYEAKTGLPFDKRGALHVGDSFENDIVGAINAGWKAALISSSKTTKNKDEPLVFENLIELKNYLNQGSS